MPHRQLPGRNFLLLERRGELDRTGLPHAKRQRHDCEICVKVLNPNVARSPLDLSDWSIEVNCPLTLIRTCKPASDSIQSGEHAELRVSRYSVCPGLLIGEIMHADA